MRKTAVVYADSSAARSWNIVVDIGAVFLDIIFQTIFRNIETHEVVKLKTRRRIEVKIFLARCS